MMSRLFFSIVGLSLCVAGGLHAQQGNQQPESRASTSITRSTAGGSVSARSSASHTAVRPAGTVVGGGNGQVVHAQGRVETAATVPPNIPDASLPLGTVGYEAMGLRQVRALQWGLSTMPLPEYLKHEQLGLEPGQGLLITGVLPGSAAELAGLKQGETIVEIDGILCDACRPLPEPNEMPRVLLILGNDGLRETHVNFGVGDGELSDLDIELLPPGLDWSGWTAPPAWATLPQVHSPVRSLAVSEANGQMHVSAVVACAGREQQVELRGNRAQVAQQLQSLSVEVQQALAPQLGL